MASRRLEKPPIAQKPLLFLLHDAILWSKKGKAFIRVQDPSLN